METPRVDNSGGSEMNYMNTDSKIKKLKTQISKQKKWYPVLPTSSLYLVTQGNSFRFIGKWKVKPYDLTIGSFNKGMKVAAAIQEWEKLKGWAEEKGIHPNKFYEPQVKTSKTFHQVANEYMEDVYKPKNKERTYKDRRNKLNQMLNYIDEHYLISDLELESGGRETIKNMLINLFQKNDANYQLIRCRQLLTAIFNYAEDENYISHNQNPVARKFQWEGDKHIKRDPKQKSFAHTLKGKSWGLLPEFLHSVNQNKCNASKITHLATKAHLLMCIRTGVISRLEWSWYNSEEDQWEIPSQTTGLKRKKDDLENDHIIPSTPAINKLMEEVKEITGWQKYCFYSFNGKSDPHLGEETINDHFRNLGWKGKQSAHGWRDVITTSALEKSDFEYDIIDRQLGRMNHKQGTRGHYDQSTLLDKRRQFMKWWSTTLIDQGLSVVAP